MKRISTLLLCLALMLSALGQGGAVAARSVSGEVITLCTDGVTTRQVIFDGQDYHPVPPMHNCGECCDGILLAVLPNASALPAAPDLPRLIARADFTAFDTVPAPALRPYVRGPPLV